MKLRPDRRFWAAIVILGWVCGLAALALRRDSVPASELLARGALRLEPSTFYYLVTHNGLPVGYATSSIDTASQGLLARDVAVVRGVFGGDSQSVTATSSAYLSRSFALDSFSFTVRSRAAPFRIHGRPVSRSGVLIPSLAPVALMLTARPDVGAQRGVWVYSPLSRRVERVTLVIAAESLFRVVDSASFDSVQRRWIPSHADTIRAWKIVTPSRAISVWVDSQGRIVAAEEPGGSQLTRTAYEIATLNRKSPVN